MKGKGKKGKMNLSEEIARKRQRDKKPKGHALHCV